MHLPHLIHGSVIDLKSKGSFMGAIISSLFLSFKNLSSCGLPHAVTTRSGGVSSGVFKSLNLAKHVGDDEKLVEQNRLIVQRFIGKKQIVFATQIHSDLITKITDKNRHQIHSCDALITDLKSVALAVMVADCVPILIYDPVHNAVGAVHAGWRGTAKNIASKTVDLMSREFGSNPADLIVGIGAAIKSCCYEVDGAVASNFKDISKPKDNLKWSVDLQSANKIDLMRSGVKNIEIMELCTRCDSRFFSYRRENITGRFVGVIGAK